MLEKTTLHGRAKLIEGCCFDAFEKMAANSLEAIVTDPPYSLFEYSEPQLAKKASGTGGVWRHPPSFDGCMRSALPRFSILKPKDIERLKHFFKGWAQAAARVLVPGAHIVMASNPLLSYAVADAICSEGFERRGEVIRLITTMRGGDRPKNSHREFPDVSVMPRSSWEPWLLFRKPCEGTVAQNLAKWRTGGLRRISADRPFFDVIPSGPATRAERRIAPHPSLKPQAFMRQVVRAVLPLGSGVVCDPFAGSGATLAAANHHQYDSVGVEKSASFAHVARSAIEPLSAFKVPGEG